jgi:hypothetical protein
MRPSTLIRKIEDWLITTARGLYAYWVYTVADLNEDVEAAGYRPIPGWVWAIALALVLFPAIAMLCLYRYSDQTGFPEDYRPGGRFSPPFTPPQQGPPVQVSFKISA